MSSVAWKRLDYVPSISRELASLRPGISRLHDRCDRLSGAPCPPAFDVLMESRIPGPGWRTNLRGRARECAALGGLLRDVRAGQSRSLVVRGEAGIGKTALLEYLISSASDLSVAWTAGVESDMELAYASLHRAVRAAARSA